MEVDPFSSLRASFSPAGLLYRSHLETILEAQKLRAALTSADMLIKALPGFDLAEHVDATRLDRDGLFRAIQNQQAADSIERVLTAVREKGREAELPFHDVDSWIGLCEDRSISGPGHSDAQRALASELLNPLIALLRESPSPATASSISYGTVEERLTRLKSMEKQGLVTSEEASSCRGAILRDL